MPIINVPAGINSYPTIQQAIDAAASGDTIIVAAGPYDEILSIPDDKENLILQGAQAGVDARNRVGAPETVIQPDASPNYGSGTINIYSKNITIDGFTFSSPFSSTTGTSAIFAAEAGAFPPVAFNINVIGLKIINNRIISNQNGILVASREVGPQTVNYLVRNNYFNNNIVNDIIIGNSIINPMQNIMTNAFVSQNLFESTGISTGDSSSIKLTQCRNSVIDYNIVNNGGSIITQFGCNEVEITNNYLNITTPVSGISVFSDNTNITIDDNTIVIGQGGTGIAIVSGNANISLNSICISSTQPDTNGIIIHAGNNNVTMNYINFSNISRGISISRELGLPNSRIQINNSNIACSVWDIYIFVGGYDISTGILINAINNWWNGIPIYRNSGAPGTGINDFNIENQQSIVYIPYNVQSVPVPCPPPVFLTKTVQQSSILIGEPIMYNISLNIVNTDPFVMNDFTDALLPDIMPNIWTINNQTPANTFQITGPPGAQILSLVSPFPTTPGIYTVIVSGMPLVSGIFVNTVSSNIIYDSRPIELSASAEVEVLVCIHRTSAITLANGTTCAIEDLKPGTKIIAANGTVVKIIRAVECLVTDPNGNCGTCIVFEPNSLGQGVPTKRFGIDAGHPIGISNNYIMNRTLIPAKEFLNGITIYDRKWDSVSDLFDGHTARYDIIMPDDSCGAYFANGIVVKSRKNFHEPGYSYF